MALCGTGGNTAGDNSPAEAWGRYKRFKPVTLVSAAQSTVPIPRNTRVQPGLKPSPTLLERNQQQKIIYAAEHASRTSVPLFSVILLESYSKDSTSLKLPQVPLHCHQGQKSLKTLESRRGEKQAKFYQLSNPEHHGLFLASFCLLT